MISPGDWTCHEKLVRGQKCFVEGKNAGSHNWIPHLQDGLFKFDTPNLKHMKVSIQSNCGNDAYLFQINTLWLTEKFQAGSHVSFYDSTGRLVNGTVQSIICTSDVYERVSSLDDDGSDRISFP
ncbi:hypothetical protein EDD85DRAFT_795211 [Armillaria nabsnona]|nr:hypothetical protein EDD85DRAFT_795211 [Armillaria nabsnona]